MARRTTPQPLTLSNPALPDDDLDFIGSPKSPLSPKSPRSPRSHFRFSKRTQSELPSMQAAESQRARTTSLSSSQTTPSLSTIAHCSGRLDQQQQYQYQQQKQRQKPPVRSGLFSNYKASKSSNHLQNNPDHARKQDERMSRDTERPAMTGRGSSKENIKSESGLDRSIARKPVGGPSQSNVSLDSNGDSRPSSAGAAVAKKHKPKPFSILSRSRSIRDENSPREPSPTNNLGEGDRLPSPSSHPPQAQSQTQSLSLSPDNFANSAPLPLDQNDRSLRAMMSSTVRQRSEDRQASAPREISKANQGSKLRDQNRSLAMKDHKDTVGRSQPSSGSFREGGGNTFLNNLKSSATKGAGALSKGLFGKGGRSGSPNEKEPVVDDEHYQIKVLNLPLMEQTRLTRISKKLEDSRDKTEFWMPAFPWRAIDYLNYKGSDVEGLYRVPGSGPQIKKWQRRFDEEYDIDLFEQDDLYDINIIGSMLKAWLREMPDELFPKTSQDRIAREAGGKEEVPQLLIDELSNLSPFNYYLLFAITCHLSLLLAHSNKNKMDYRNLCICFQPCMKIDAYCFKFLVCNWRECWKGCKTEQYYVEQEYILFDMITPSSAEGRSSTAVESHDERNVSSSDSSKPSSVSIDQAGKNGNSHTKKLPISQIQSSSAGTTNTALTAVQERTSPPKSTPKSTEMRPLSPIKPLSPIGF